MKLYKVTRPIHELNDEDFDGVVQFAGTQADARKVRIDFEAPFKFFKPKDRPDVVVEEVDVPTDKAGL
ncbi:MAG TPA: hypothetical protein PLR50_13355, partial [Candidatus Rifleibacterium sp.]|nr:hypothetical protein [Candidatus Rifleibacterium sp.]